MIKIFKTGGGLFGASGGFGTAASGSTTGGTTAVKFQPPDGTDSMIKNGQSQTVKTKHYCITAMKQYETKCLEVSKLLAPVLVSLTHF